jgi:ABC-2 type transport system ATP-binding protein/lipopolysaccharide transport system ATP-binding protein
MPGSIDARTVTLDIPVYDAGRSGLRRTLIKAITPRTARKAGDGPVILRVLDELTFSIAPGGRVALLGRNGAGKTTLLHLLAGFYTPTQGTARVMGRLSTLLALVDPDPEGTVLENIRLSGLLRGVRGARLARLVDDVLDFSELEAYAEMPVRILSAGMRMRLSYGVATGIACDVLLVDEIIGVGDAAFLKKASRRFHEATRGISVLVLATHAMALAEEFCDQAFLLDRGALRAQGPLSEIAQLYLQTLADDTISPLGACALTQ